MSAVPTEVARRYAKALFELATESGTLETVVTEIANIADAYEGNKELARALDNPLVALDAKRAILRDLADGMKVSAITKHTLLLLGDRRRANALSAVARSLAELADKKKGIVRAEVTSAVNLPDAYYDRLKTQLERVTGKKITIDRRIDPAILGGVVARIGDRIFDGSLQSRLSEVRQHLLPN
jgi:F-type H+-transporting ATPase subunit delta